MGETIESALRARRESPEFNYSFDMLGEAALTAADAERYFDAYAAAIDGRRARRRAAGTLLDAPSVSVKLSALCPRYEVAQSARAVRELGAQAGRARRSPRARRRRPHGGRRGSRSARAVARDLRSRCFATRSSRDYAGLGLAVQAYQKRACASARVARRRSRAADGRTIPVRLVKGAYWDSEIKRAQEQGLDGYPGVHAQVQHRRLVSRVREGVAARAPTLVSAVRDAQRAHRRVAARGRRAAGRSSSSACTAWARSSTASCSSGPASRAAAASTRRSAVTSTCCRTSCGGCSRTARTRRSSIGSCRRTRAIDDDRRGSRRGARAALPTVAHPRIPLPRDLFAPERANSRGTNLAVAARARGARGGARARREVGRWRARPRDRRRGACPAPRSECRDPADRRAHRRRRRGRRRRARRAAALDVASAFAPRWNATPADAARGTAARARPTSSKPTRAELVARCVAETGKTVPDSLAEVREAVDLLRYYAAQCERVLARATRLPGPTGERNELELIGPRRVLLHQPVEFPARDLHGAGRRGARGGQHRDREAGRAGHARRGARRRAARAGRHSGRRAAVPARRRPNARRGAARRPARRGRRVHGLRRDGARDQLARSRRATGPLATLIAETGGVNAMIVDSSALPEQVVRDALTVGVQQRGPALLGAAPAVPAGAHGRRDPADAVRRDGRARRRRSAAARDRRRPRHRRGRAHGARRATSASTSAPSLHRCRLGAAHAHGLFVAPTVHRAAARGRR